ncbi:hypothetical protein HQ584_02700 [Patescibacteria group bacterium]|nr:hypothetical protein [Patescibacteria group bacterium]
MKLDKVTFQKWFDWVEKIRNDIEIILNHQQICEYFEKTVNANLDHVKKNDGRTFCDFVRANYAISAAACIRRHERISRDSISLMKLLDQIKKCADQFTYNLYLEYYPLNPVDPPWHVWQKLTFMNFSDDGKIISEEKIDQDMKEIENIAGKVSNFADRVISHLDPRGIEEKITYGDLDSSLELLNKISCKYITLITSAGYVTLKPTIQTNWKRIFTVPLDIQKYENST